jgi:4-hydroxy-3-polyprenylbenzoate decarboxylase
MKKKIAVGITAASGSIYAKTLLERLDAARDQLEEVGVTMTTFAKDVWQYELGNESWNDFTFYAKRDFSAPFASGSAGFDALIVCPCSMGTMGRIASGLSTDLLTRAADVMLKERKKLILVIRETPFSLIHINNMKTITEAGGIICPANPSFYSRPQNFSELAATVVDRALQLAGLDLNTFRWGKTELE